MILPTFLSYSRSSAPSAALMFAEKYDGQIAPLEIHTLRGRGAKCDYSAGHGEQDTDLGQWMPLAQDICQLPHNAPRLRIIFSLKYLPNSLTPNSCNSLDWIRRLEQLSKQYALRGGYLYQAHCQMDALFQGLPFWRNNDSEAMSITITNISDKILPPYRFGNLPCEANYLADTDKAQFDSLVSNIARALTGQRKILRLRISASLQKDILEEIHPSEEFVQKFPDWLKEKHHQQKKYQKSRYYAFYRLGDIRQAMLNSTKISAGLRWDLWNNSKDIVPVSVYGLNTRTHQALRGRGSNQDFYSLLRKVESFNKTLNEFNGNMLSEENINKFGDIHFVMANLIKGGVYSRDSSKNKKQNSLNSSEEKLMLTNP
ncbi:type I-F CRISPR-associated protein Cas7f/Csy3 [Endozoicomonas euniceicola]|uniref:Type I-F CRISPR-associated protein Cas7f/Csy3 n=1 Tax=Endozoicomonas euniceicola TaxID=1234143 RepID=A0ABY6GY04_9GAMM|nr:type I-F CRISPR-associated protein Cas7f/Csy3 [Endozoicomonas euniceicola]UYM17673.1 type I-F CRISPR-associated protein Cas7f/Csy3 [Endozoicomonas euniceicola]